MLSYLWEKDGVYYGIDGSQYNDVPSAQEISSLQTFAKQFVNDRAGYEALFNQYIAPVLGRSMTDEDFNPDTSCRINICNVSATVGREGTQRVVNVTTTLTDNGCYDISFAFPDLTGSGNLGRSVAYCDRPLDNTEPIDFNKGTHIYTGVLFSSNLTVDANNKQKYAWFVTGGSESGVIPISTYVTYAFIRTSSEPATPVGGTYANPGQGIEPWSLTVDNGNPQVPVWMSIGRFQDDNQGHTGATWEAPTRMMDTSVLQTEWANDSDADGFYEDYVQGLSVLPDLNEYVNETGGTDMDSWEDFVADNEYGNWVDTLTDAKYMAYCTRNNGVWGQWTVVKVVGEDGSDGKSAYPPATIFATLNEGAIAAAPNGGTYDSNYVVRGVTPNYWSQNNQSESGKITWLSTGIFNGLSFTWTNPLRITGENGEDGTDGESREFIYRRFESTQALTDYVNSGVLDPYLTWDSPISSAGTAEYQTDNFTPLDWEDNPVGVSDTMRIEACCTRTKREIGGVVKWDVFTEPFVWSSWGENGIDGDGVEYIFCSTATADEDEDPDTGEITEIFPTSEATYPPLNFATASTETLAQNSLFRGWFDDETAMRIIYDYYQMSGFVPDGGWDLVTLRTIARKYMEDPSDAYLQEIINSFDWDWTDNPVDVTREYPYEWVSMRRFKKGDKVFGETTNTTKVWEEFSIPKLWAKYSKDGESSFKAFAFTRTNVDISDMPVTGGTYNDPVPGDPVQHKIRYNNIDYYFYDSVPADSQNKTIWVTTCMFALSTDGETHVWSSPQRMSDSTDFDVEWSTDDLTQGQIDRVKGDAARLGVGETDEHWRLRMSEGTNASHWQGNGDDAIYMATATLKDGAWSTWTVSKIKGETGDGISASTNFYITGATTDEATIIHKYDVVTSANTYDNAITVAQQQGFVDEPIPTENLPQGVIEWCFTLLGYTDGTFSTLPITTYVNTKIVNDITTLSNVFGAASIDSQPGVFLREFIAVAEYVDDSNNVNYSSVQPRLLNSAEDSGVLFGDGLVGETEPGENTRPDETIVPGNGEQTLENGEETNSEIGGSETEFNGNVEPTGDDGVIESGNEGQQTGEQVQPGGDEVIEGGDNTGTSTSEEEIVPGGGDGHAETGEGEVITGEDTVGGSSSGQDDGSGTTIRPDDGSGQLNGGDDISNDDISGSDEGSNTTIGDDTGSQTGGNSQSGGNTVSGGNVRVKAFINATDKWYDSDGSKGRLMFASGIDSLGQTADTSGHIDMSTFSATTKIWENGLLECKNANVEGEINTTSGRFGNNKAAFIINENGIIGTVTEAGTPQTFMSLTNTGATFSGEIHADSGSFGNATTKLSINDKGIIGTTITNDNLETTFMSLTNTGATFSGKMNLDYGKIGPLGVDVESGITFPNRMLLDEGERLKFRIDNNGFLTSDYLVTAATSDSEFIITSSGITSTRHEDSGGGYLKSYFGSFTEDGACFSSRTDVPSYYLYDETHLFGDASDGLSDAGFMYLKARVSKTTNKTFYFGQSHHEWSSSYDFYSFIQQQDLYNYTNAVLDSSGLILRHGTATDIGSPTNVVTKIKLDTTSGGITAATITANTLYTTGAITAATTIYGNNLDIKQSVHAYNLYYSGECSNVSDLRLKDLGEPLSDVLSNISKIPTTYFTWKKDEDKKQQIGTVAQGLQEAYPELVTEMDDGILAVDYAKLSIIAIAAIKELKAEVDELKAEINKLKGK